MSKSLIFENENRTSFQQQIKVLYEFWHFRKILSECWKFSKILKFKFSCFLEIISTQQLNEMCLNPNPSKLWILFCRGLCPLRPPPAGQIHQVSIYSTLIPHATTFSWQHPIPSSYTASVINATFILYHDMTYVIDIRINIHTIIIMHFVSRDDSNGLLMTVIWFVRNSKSVPFMIIETDCDASMQKAKAKWKVKT